MDVKSMVPEIDLKNNYGMQKSVNAKFISWSQYHYLYLIPVCSPFCIDT